MNRGAVFTTDSMLATSVLLLFMVIAAYYIQDAQRSRWSDVMLMRTAYDIGTAFDRTGVFASNNESMIVNMLNKTKPPNVNVNVRVNRYPQGNLSLGIHSEYGDTINATSDRLTQRVISTDPRGDYYMAEIRVAYR